MSYMDDLRRKRLDTAEELLNRAARTLATAREAAYEVAVGSETVADIERANALHEAAQNALNQLAAHRRAPAGEPELLTADQVDELLQQGARVVDQLASYEAPGQWAAGAYALRDGRTVVVLPGGNGVLDSPRARV